MKANANAEQPSQFAEQVDILFHEAEMAIKWQRPSILFAVYRSEALRAAASAALEEKLNQAGQTVQTIHAQELREPDLIAYFCRPEDEKNTFYFIDGLKWECNAQGANIVKEINKQRETLIDESVRAIFWLKEDEVSYFATNATECWILRHRVVDFTNTSRAEEILLSALEAGPGSNASPGIDGIPFAASPREVLGLEEGPQSDLQYASNLLTLGILYWRKGEAQTGLKLLRASQEIAGLCHDTTLIAKSENAIALIQASQGDVDDAIASYTKSKATMPDTKVHWKIYGFLLAKRERYEEAIHAFRRSLSVNPQDPACWLGLGQVFLKLRQHDNSISCFKKALEIAPTFKEALLGAGHCYLDAGQFHLAQAACEKALALDNTTGEAWLILSKCHAKEGKYAQAVGACENAIELDGANAAAWNEIGNLYLLEKEYEKSILAYQTAIELQPELGWAYASMALAFEKKGNSAEAIALYQQSVPLFEKNEDRAAIWQKLGSIYIDLKDEKKADACYRQAEWLTTGTLVERPEPGTTETEPAPLEDEQKGDDPMNESSIQFDILTARDWNELGNSHLRAGAYNEAVQAYTRAIELAKDMQWPYIKNLATANFHLGKAMGKMAECDSPDPDVWGGDEHSPGEKDFYLELDLPLAQRGDLETDAKNDAYVPETELLVAGPGYH